MKSNLFFTKKNYSRFIIFLLSLIVVGCNNKHKNLDPHKNSNSDNHLLRSDPAWTKDANYVYYNKFKKEEIDLTTFQLIGGSYVRDKNNIYWAGGKVKKADLNSFKLLENNYEYGKDKNAVFFQGIAIKDADPESFIATGDNTGKDKNNTFTAWNKK